MTKTISEKVQTLPRGDDGESTLSDRVRAFLNGHASSNLLDRHLGTEALFRQNTVKTRSGDGPVKVGSLPEDSVSRRAATDNGEDKSATGSGSAVGVSRDGIDDSVRLYMREIGSIPLLTAQEEVDLATLIEMGLLEEQRLRGNDLDEQTLRQSWLKVKNGRRAYILLAESNLRLVVSVAKRYLGRGLPMLDLIQEGNIGLLRGREVRLPQGLQILNLRYVVDPPSRNTFDRGSGANDQDTGAYGRYDQQAAALLPPANPRAWSGSNPGGNRQGDGPA